MVNRHLEFSRLSPRFQRKYGILTWFLIVLFNVELKTLSVVCHLSCSSIECLSSALFKAFCVYLSSFLSRLLSICCFYILFLFKYSVRVCVCVVYMCASVYVPICGHMDICRSKVDIASLARMFFTLFIEIRYLTCPHEYGYSSYLD